MPKSDQVAKITANEPGFELSLKYFTQLRKV